jgi:adenosylcobinamide kinase/adenosylcobinamide-phosphate guanylyltransferase
MPVELVLGGARSGKSAYAERQARESGRAVTVIVTARSLDAEMGARIAHHRALRPAHWRTVEAPFDLAAALRAEAQEDRCLIVDCLTLWATNHLCPPDLPATPPTDWAAARDDLLDTVPSLHGQIVFVSNEIGSGVVPLGEATRRFVDEVGRLNQALAQRCDRVTLVAAGLPLRLKDRP